MNHTSYATYKFLTELLLATAVYVFPFEKRKRFPLRLSLALGVCFLCSYLTSPFLLRYHLWEPSVMYLPSILRYLFLYAMVTLTVWLCFDITARMAVFVSAGSYAIQHMTLKTQNLVETLYYGAVAQWTVVVLYTLFLAAAYGVVYFLILRNLVQVESAALRANDTFLFHLLTVASLIVASVLDGADQRSIAGNWGYACYGVLCGIFLLCMQFDIFTKSALRAENAQIEYILAQERRQFDSFRAGVEYLDIKCHDLKHQLLRLKGGQSIPDQAIAEIEDEIARYEAYSKTGNTALDIIIGEKFLHCAQEHIAFTPVIKGERVNLLAETDLYSLFGNALDNAIEYERTQPEEKRFIRLNVNDFGDMLLIRIENGYEGAEVYDVDSLTTTKENKLYHGFGMKSMRHIVEKYGGAMDVAAHDGVFALTFAFTFQK